MEAMMTKTRCTDHGIIFQGWGVRAILEGRKTQTRRIIKPQPETFGGIPVFISDEITEDFSGAHYKHIKPGCPYGQPGDRLWVRECWKADSFSGRKLDTETPVWEYFIAYKATDGQGRDRAKSKSIVFDKPPLNSCPGNRDGWKPSIHMPRWASRIDLEITNIKVERVQDISEEDAKAEGWPGFEETEKLLTIAGGAGIKHFKSGIQQGPLCWYFNVWCQINGIESWSANPWVCVVEFKRLKP